MSFNKTTFAAKVKEIEIANAGKVLDLRQMVDDRSAELQGDEAVLNTYSVTVGSVAAMPIALADYATTADTVNTQKALSLNKDFGKVFEVKAGDQRSTNINIYNVFAQTAELAHRDNRNKVLLAQVAGAAQAGSQALKYKDTTNSIIAEDDFLTAAQKLDDAKAPQEGRYCAISATDYSNLFSISNFISRDKMGHLAEAIPKNVIGWIHGFEIIKIPTGLMPKLDGTTGKVSTATGAKTCTLFWQSYAVMYASQIYRVVGPELRVGSDSEFYNLHAKFGADPQINTFGVSIRAS